MPYLYFGKTSLYKGRPLFKLLCKLKDHGRGRIVYRTIDHYDHPGEISFYRILQAQPLMDSETLHGRVVAERVHRGLRRKEPVVLSSVAHKPDFRLVPRDEEEAFCQWDKVRDYDRERDAPVKPARAEMPPLLREFVARAREARGESINEEDFHLPAERVYRGEFNLDRDVVDTDDLGQHLTEEFSTHRDFDMGLVPEDWSMTTRPSYEVGKKAWAGYMEGHKEWDVQKDLDEEYERLKQKQKDSLTS